MPTVRIRMYEGRSDETKDTLAKEVKDVVANHTKNRVESVTVIYDEIPRPDKAGEAPAKSATTE